MAARSKADRSPAEIVGSNPTWGMDVCLLWVLCMLSEVYATSWSLVQRSSTDCGASLCVWSRNLVNEESLAHWGLSHQKQSCNKFVEVSGHFVCSSLSCCMLSLWIANDLYIMNSLVDALTREVYCNRDYKLFARIRRALWVSSTVRCNSLCASNWSITFLWLYVLEIVILGRTLFAGGFTNSLLVVCQCMLFVFGH